MIFNIKDFEKVGKLKVKKVKDMLSNGKNIYRNIEGFEDEVNYELIDIPLSKSGLERHVISMTILHPGKVGKEFKMTTGHSHPGVEEVYIFLEGEGEIILKKDNDKKIHKIGEGDIASIPSGYWHRVVNTGEKKLIFISIFEKYGERG
ncbi:MAG: hypothetical protein DRP11_00300 [Candidatus Aenigmatarchaeota archaeon]|nr:MAG: hypothetical protein DRP11_00300 [Candidatus Aenigmarchaeota archaeon]